MKKPAARDEWERAEVRRASYFTTFRFGGRDNRERREFHPTDESDAARRDALARARADAGDDRRVLVYAVTPEGGTVPVASTIEV